MFKDKLCKVIEKFYRFSYTTGENLTMVIDESAYFDEIDNAKIKSIDFSWLIPNLDGYLAIEDDNGIANYLLAEELISVATQFTWVEDDDVLKELYELFDNQIYKSCSNSKIAYKLSDTFTYEVFKNLIRTLYNTNQLEYILVLGWVGHRVPILAIMEI